MDTASLPGSPVSTRIDSRSLAHSVEQVLGCHVQAGILYDKTKMGYPQKTVEAYTSTVLMQYGKMLSL
jgi:hypothetical protein